MKALEAFFAIISGCAVAWVVGDFLNGYGIRLGFLYNILLYFAISIISLLCLQLVFVIGKRFLFILQAGKHLIVGAFATVIDLKIFEVLVYFFSISFTITPIFLKAISFLISTVIKYWGNKYWAFEKFEKENLLKEFSQFFAITTIGLIIDIGIFYYLTEITGSQLAMPATIWVRLSVIIAAVVAAVWNFTAYKFLVFKK